MVALVFSGYSSGGIATKSDGVHVALSKIFFWFQFKPQAVLYSVNCRHYLSDDKLTQKCVIEWVLFY